MLKKRNRELVLQAAKEQGIPKDIAMHAYKAYWMFIKKTIEEFPLNDADEEYFKNNSTSINIPGLGKFFTTFKRVKNIDKAKKIVNERIKNKSRKATT